MYANGKLEAQKEKRMKGDGGGGEEEREGTDRMIEIEGKNCRL